MNRNSFNKIKLVRFALTMLLIGLQSSFLYSQPFISDKRHFSVDQKRGCAPFTVTILETDLELPLECTTSNCLFYFEGGPPKAPTPTSSFTYTTPGKYMLTVFYTGSEPSTGKNIDQIEIIVDEFIKPNFDVYSCNNNSVAVEIKDNNYAVYDVDFGDGTIVSQPANQKIAINNYTSLGRKIITVSGKKDNGTYCIGNFTEFIPVRNLPRVELTSLKAIDKTRVQIDFTPLENIQYRLEIATNGISGFQQLPNPSESISYSATVRDLDQQFYCFRIQAFDRCLNTVRDEAYSQILCTPQISLNIQSGLNAVSWKSNETGLDNNEAAVSIYRNDDLYSGVPYNPTTFEDQAPSIECNNDYTYYVVFNYANGATSTSLKKSGKSFFTQTPVAISNVSAITENQSVNLTWLEPPKDPILSAVLSPNTYSVFKSINKSSYEIIPDVKIVGTEALSNPSKLNYLDNAYSELSSTCYKINYTDRCGNKSAEGIEACPVVLQGSIDKKNTVSLVWNDYSGWQNGVQTYQVDKFAADGTLLTSTKVNASKLIDDIPDLKNQIVSYKITALANDGNLDPSTSNIITLTKEANFFYPTAFTPNGDNLNDKFGVLGQFVDKMDFKVYDRWGGLIFSTEKNEPWNGYYNGKLANEGAYIWKAVITDLAGRTSSYAGTVLLLRR
jgi:gliding motility-associated-like protein